VLLKKTELFKTVIPTKMLEFMACARPVILGVDGQARRILEEAQAGLFVEPENPGALTQAIMRLAADSELRESMGSNGARHILLHFSREQTANDYAAVLGSVVSEKGF
jgi:glycosyltransferase involved in cell wall biosynthesis